MFTMPSYDNFSTSNDHAFFQTVSEEDRFAFLRENTHSVFRGIVLNDPNFIAKGQPWCTCIPNPWAEGDKEKQCNWDFGWVPFCWLCGEACTIQHIQSAKHFDRSLNPAYWLQHNWRGYRAPPEVFARWSVECWGLMAGPVKIFDTHCGACAPYTMPSLCWPCLYHGRSTKDNYCPSYTERRRPMG